MSRTKYRIGLLVDYIVSEYSSLIIQGVRTACKDFDIELVIFTIGELHSIQTPYEYQYVAITSLVNKNNLDGIIMTSGTQNHYLSKDELISYIRSFNPLPIVNIAAEIPTIPSIIVEPFSAYDAIIEELITNQNCLKFGIMGVRGNSTDVKTRIGAIKTSLIQHNIPEENINLWLANFDYRTTRNELNNWYENKKSFEYDAIFALNDEMAFACIDFCRDINLRIPEDVVVVGFDNLNRDTFSNPTLTSITQDIPSQGYSAVLTLKEAFAGGVSNLTRKVEAKAILRESTCRKPYSKNVSEKKCVIIDLKEEDSVKNNQSASEWYSKRSEFLHISQFFTEMQTSMSTQKIKSRINNDLRSFGIRSAAIVVYHNPIEMVTPFDYFNLPHKAELFSAFDEERKYDSSKEKKTIKFDPNESLVPDNIITFDSEGMYAMALYHETLQFGYILYRPGNYDVVCYELLIKMTSTIISSAYQFTLVNNEQTKFKNKSHELNIIAHTDELTGLLNRRGLYELGQTTLKFAKSMKQSGIIVYCDMDGLKKINDNFGHEAGDKAIAVEGKILRDNFRSNDVVSRIGGDEFAIISPGLNPESFERIKNQINEDCDSWVKDNNSPFKLGISMGCIAYPAENNNYSITSLLAEADAKLYEEKHRKKEN